MALKYKLDTLEGLDEALKSFYRKDGDKFILDVDESGAKAALQVERNRAEAAEKALKERESNEAKAKADAEKAQLEAKGDYEKLKASIEAEKAALAAATEKATGALKANVLKTELMAAIAEQKGSPLLQKLIEDQFEVVSGPDDSHKVVFKKDPGQTPGKFLESLKKDPAYGGLFAGVGATGGQAPAGSGPTTPAGNAAFFDPKSPQYNYTKQMEVAKANPAEFDALRAQFPTQ